MKQKSLILSALFFAVVTTTAILFNSCQKDETVFLKNNAISSTKTSTTEISNAEISNAEISLKDDALSFQTADAFFETSQKLGAMTDKERQDWEISMGFVSMRTELNNIFEQVEEAEDEAAIEQIVASNSDLVKLVDGEVHPIIKSNAYAAITNRKGIFFVEGVIHKVEGGKIASSEDGNEQTVNNALHSNLKSVGSGIHIIRYDGGYKIGGCGTRLSAYREVSKRKCDFEMKISIYYCSGCCGNYYEQVKVESIITNYKKYLGGWHKYNTACTMEDRSYTIPVPKVTGYYTGSDGMVHTSIYYQDVTQSFGTTNSNDDCSTMTQWHFVGDRVENISIGYTSFKRVKGLASNRGIGNNWAEIYCGAW